MDFIRCKNVYIYSIIDTIILTDIILTQKFRYIGLNFEQICIVDIGMKQEFYFKLLLEFDIKN